MLAVGDSAIGFGTGAIAAQRIVMAFVLWVSLSVFS